MKELKTTLIVRYCWLIIQKNEIEKILLEREKYYNLANLKINTDNKSVDDIKKEILDVLWKKL